MPAIVFVLALGAAVLAGLITVKTAALIFLGVGAVVVLAWVLLVFLVARSI